MKDYKYRSCLYYLYYSERRRPSDPQDTSSTLRVAIPPGTGGRSQVYVWVGVCLGSGWQVAMYVWVVGRWQVTGVYVGRWVCVCGGVVKECV